MAAILRKPIAWLAAGVLLLLAAWWLYGVITAKPKAEARLGRNQVEAAQANASDAVNAVGTAAAREGAATDLTRTNEQEIRNADGADAPVSAGVRDAGLASLCRRDSYKRDPRCVQLADPR